MFGTFRFMLAVMVLLTHIGGIEVVAGIGVWGFFMLSGFLMTAILNNKYGFSSIGLIGFATSRAIRLLPTYWFTLFITAILVLVFGPSVDPRLVNDALAIPVTPREILSNLFIVGHTTFGIGRITNALSPSAWAVDVEIMMYTCSCFFLARSERLTRVALGVLLICFPLLYLTAKYLIAHDQMILASRASQLIYSFLPVALIPYSMGTYLWFVRERIRPYLTSLKACMVSIPMLFICALVVSKISVTAAYVASLPFLAIIVIELSYLNNHGIIGLIDELLGRMSYPIYLSQWLCAYIVVLFSPLSSLSLLIVTHNRIRFTFMGFLTVVAVVMVFSLLLAVVIEGPIEGLRHRLVQRLIKGTAPQNSM
jgi:peptidoglycan/LPS O-acetylase OafA/YrhL